jgi:4-amino-4-deoxy-L-arabinose transferase-like glycosyltransferase
MENSRVAKYEILSFFLVALLLLLWGNQSTVLWNQDEAAYAGFAKKMIQSGDWLIPDYFWSDVHRKTPFHFWMIALSMLLFGINEFATRFSSVLFTMGTLAIIIFLGRKIWSERIAFASAFILLSSVLVTAIAKIAVTDATLLFFETWCALSLLLVLQSKKRTWILQFWISLSLAVLTKGPPVIIFTGTLGLLCLIFHPKGKNIWKLFPFIFFPIALIPLFVWGYFAWQVDNGEFITWMIDWYILRRVDGNVFGQTGPPGYYLVVFLISFWIWLPFLLSAIWKSIPLNKNKQHLEWGLWLIAGWFLYEFMSSKLPAYAIAAHPAIAIGIAHIFDFQISNKTNAFRRGYYIFLCISFVLYLTCFFLFYHSIEPQFILPFIFYILFLHLAIFLISIVLRNNTLVKSKHLIYFAALIPNFIIWFWILPLTQPALNGHTEISSFLQNEAFDGELKVIVGNQHGKPPSLPFYLEKAGHQIEIESDTIKLWEMYNTSEATAFILSLKQLDFLKQNSPGIQSREFQSFSVDHQKMELYFVVLKK